ncbi:hypothetical protein C8R43DRAFT_941777 [Mycena crocata]|nr:hypothetical protein C8R43DRAFT_941777 [Mycena crocata]
MSEMQAGPRFRSSCTPPTSTTTSARGGAVVDGLSQSRPADEAAVAGGGTRFHVKRERRATGGRAPAKAELGRDSVARARPRRRRRRAPEAAPSLGGCRKAGPLQEAAVAGGVGVVQRKCRRLSRKRQQRRGGGCKEATPPRLKRRQGWGGGGAGAKPKASRGCGWGWCGSKTKAEPRLRGSRARPQRRRRVRGAARWSGCCRKAGPRPRQRWLAGVLERAWVTAAAWMQVAHTASLRRSAVGGVAGQQDALSRRIRQSAILRLQDESAVVADRDALECGGRFEVETDAGALRACGGSGSRRGAEGLEGSVEKAVGGEGGEGGRVGGANREMVVVRKREGSPP